MRNQKLVFEFNGNDGVGKTKIDAEGSFSFEEIIYIQATFMFPFLKERLNEAFFEHEDFNQDMKEEITNSVVEITSLLIGAALKKVLEEDGGVANGKVHSA